MLMSTATRDKEKIMKFGVKLLKPSKDKSFVEGWISVKDPDKTISACLRSKDGKLLRTAVNASVPAEIPGFLQDQGVRNILKFHFILEKTLPNEFYLVVTEQNEEEGEKNRYGILLNKKALYVESTLPYKLVSHISRYGLKNTYKRVKMRLGFHGTNPYAKWREQNLPSEAELRKQREENLQGPKFSVLVPIFRTPLNFLREMVGGIQNQTYTNWELCLAIGSPEDQPLIDEIHRMSVEDGRIRYKILEKNLGISGNTNEALAMATGDFVGLMDHDDTVEPDLLYSFAKRIAENPAIDSAYTDEDKLVGDTGVYKDAFFKPDFNLELLRTCNYITHFFVTRTEIARSFGGFSSCYDGSQDYDFILRSCEKSRVVCHIPKMLYHWRIHGESTAENPENKLYCYESARKAIEDHMERCGCDAKVSLTSNYGIYRIKFRNPYKGKLLVCLLETDKTGKRSKEWQRLLGEMNLPECEISVQVLSFRTEEDRLKGAKRLNSLVKESDATAFLVLEDLIRPFGAEVLDDLLRQFQRTNVAALTTMLVSDKDSLVQGGHSLGLFGTAGPLYVGSSTEGSVYFNMEKMVTECIGMLPHFALFERESFDEAGRFDEALSGDLMMTDLSLRLLEIGKKTIYDGQQRIVYDKQMLSVPNKQNYLKATKDEIQRFRKRHAKMLLQGDPTRSPQLSNWSEELAYKDKKDPREDDLRQLYEDNRDYADLCRYTETDSAEDRLAACRDEAGGGEKILIVYEGEEEGRVFFEKALKYQVSKAYTLSPKDEHSFVLLVTKKGRIDKNAVLNIREFLRGTEEKESLLLVLDEDELTHDADRYANPLLKPEFSPELLYTSDYFGNAVLMSRDLYEALPKKASTYEKHLFLSDKAKTKKHLSKTVFHVDGCVMPLVGEAAQQKAGEALVRFLAKKGTEAKFTVMPSRTSFRLTYLTKDEPLISILIPNKDHSDDLRNCLESLINQSFYRRFEILVIENNSTGEEIFRYYEEIRERFENVRVLYYPKKGFNYSAVNNFAVREAKGDYLLFLNNDTKLLSYSALNELLGALMQDGVCGAGSQLLNTDGSIQHAGVVLRLGGPAGHVYADADPDSGLNHGLNWAMNNYSALTAACLMVRKEDFLRVNGFDEGLPVNYNDVDLCRRLTKETGGRLVYCPYALLEHFGSKSRSSLSTEEGKARLRKEQKLYYERWEDGKTVADPSYNPHFALNNPYFILKNLSEEGLV